LTVDDEEELAAAGVEKSWQLDDVDRSDFYDEPDWDSSR